MSERQESIDKTDRAILEILQKDCRAQLNQISNKIGVPKSTVRYRIKRMESKGIISDYCVKVDPTKLGKDYVAISHIRAKYGPNYHERIGNLLAQISGAWGVYFVFGETDFIVISRSKNREDFMKKLEKITNMPEIERHNTQIVGKVIKEDPRIEL